MSSLSTFAIRKQKLADRCEVCHWPDQYDPQTGHCQRCGQMVYNLTAHPTVINHLEFPLQAKQWFWSLATMTGLLIVIGFFCGLIGALPLALLCFSLAIFLGSLALFVIFSFTAYLCYEIVASLGSKIKLLRKYLG
jgi:hypothetical protein